MIFQTFDEMNGISYVNLKRKHPKYLKKIFNDFKIDSELNLTTQRNNFQLLFPFFCHISGEYTLERSTFLNYFYLPKWLYKYRFRDRLR